MARLRRFLILALLSSALAAPFTSAAQLQAAASAPDRRADEAALMPALPLREGPLARAALSPVGPSIPTPAWAPAHNWRGPAAGEAYFRYNASPRTLRSGFKFSGEAVRYNPGR
jgi:hypothetical protein